MSMKIYTRTGDEGETGLFGGGQNPKDHARDAAYGEVDELNSAIGMARATQPVQFFDPVLELVQRDLFAIGGHLATPDPDKVAKALEKADLSADHVTEFERLMDVPEPELLAWIMGQAQTPADHDTALFRRICAFHAGAE